MDDTKWEELYAIANQCPYYGGNAVFAARKQYAYYNPEINWNDDELCAAKEDPKGEDGKGEEGKGDEGKDGKGGRMAKVSANGLVVYPNPMQELLQIQCSGCGDEAVQVEIVNVLGEQVLLTKRKLNTAQVIDVKALIPGLYMLKLCNENGILFTTKIVK
jgi:hypothetical protein